VLRASGPRSEGDETTRRRYSQSNRICGSIGRDRSCLENSVNKLLNRTDFRSSPLAETPTGNADNPVSKIRLLNPSKSMANLFFQKEIMSPRSVLRFKPECSGSTLGAGCCRNRAESTRADVYLYPAGARGVAARKCNVAGVHTNSRRVEALRHLLEVDVKIRGWTVTSDG
jgi:hypothetical protein